MSYRCPPGPYGKAGPNHTVILTDEGRRMLTEWIHEYPSPAKLMRHVSPARCRILSKNGFSEDDLNSLAMAASVHAMGLYDPSRGCKFVTYLAEWMRSYAEQQCRVLKRVPNGKKYIRLDIIQEKDGDDLYNTIGSDDIGLIGLEDTEERGWQMNRVRDMFQLIQDERTKEVVRMVYGIDCEPVMQKILAKKYKISRKGIYNLIKAGISEMTSEPLEAVR